MTTCWLGIAAADHVRLGRDGGFAQLGHGKLAAVKSLRCGDWLVYYSPKDRLDGGAVVQAFTAIGRVTSAAPYQVQQTDCFAPFRVDVAYIPDAQPVPIHPLLVHLDLTKDRGAQWGIVMRRSKSRLSPRDMTLIAAAMGVAPAQLTGL